MVVHNILSKKEFDDAKGQSGVMIIDCFATWCGPCKVISPQLVSFSDVYTNARFYKIDVDELPDLAQELEIRAMPTFIIYKDSQKVGTVVGASPDALEKAIKEAL